MGSAQLYDDAWTFADSVSGDVADADQRQAAAAGVSCVRMQLAVEAQRHGNYDQARKQVVDVLRVDPKNSSAAQFAMVNNQLIEASRGTRPSAQAMERQKETQEENIQIAQLVQDGKLDVSGCARWMMVELKMKEALARDLNNQAAVLRFEPDQAKHHSPGCAVDERNVASLNCMVQVEKLNGADDNARNKLTTPRIFMRARTRFIPAPSAFDDLREDQLDCF